MILAVVGHGVFPYNPLLLIDGGIVGVLVVLPIYYCWLARTYQRTHGRADTGATRLWMIVPAILPVIYGVCMVVWAFQESVWFSYTSTYGTRVGGVRVGNPSAHLIGLLVWFALTGLPYVLLPRILRQCKPFDQSPASRAAADPDRRAGLPKFIKLTMVAYVVLLLPLIVGVIRTVRQPDEPLHEACFNGDAVQASKLVAAGADVNLASSMGHKRFSSLVHVLICMLGPQSHSAYYCWTPGARPLHIAAFQGNMDIVNTLLNAGADVEQTDSDGMTSLYRSLFHANAAKDPAVLRRLLAAGASPNAYANNGETPFHYACQYGDPEIVRAMLRAGAGVHLLTRGKGNLGGSTPLHEAVWYQNEDQVAEVISILLAAGANINAQTVEGNTALQLAGMCGKPRAAAALLDAGADIAVRNRYGETAWDQGSHLPETLRNRMLPNNGAE